MSITHSLIVASEMTPSKMRELMLNSSLGLRPGRDDYLRGEGVHVSVSKETELGQAVVSDDFGFRPILSIIFDMESNEDEDEGYRIVGRVVVAWLQREAGDMVLLFLGEDVVVQRLNGCVMLIEDWHEWLTPQLGAAGIRYERRPAMTPAA